MVSMSAIREASGLRVGRTLDELNSQNPSKYQANVTKLSDKRRLDRNAGTSLCFQYAVLGFCSQLEFKSADGRRWAQMKGKSVYFDR